MAKKRKISDADAAIWSEVLKSVEPLRRIKKPSLTKSTSAIPLAEAPQAQSFTIDPFQIGSKAQGSSKKPTEKSSKNMDRRNYDRLIRGQKKIDMTVDLHGMTQDQAKRHLQARLMNAHAAGLRLVLVITGKGNKTSTDEFNRPRAGILRSSLPDWCRGAPLSSIILQVVHAQQKHGGTGAYYVYLRRAR